MRGLAFALAAVLAAGLAGMAHTQTYTEQTGMLSDGTQVMIKIHEVAANESMRVNVIFEASEHVNYGIQMVQNDTTVLDVADAHAHDGTGAHVTDILPSNEPLDIRITFRGYGIGTITGPVGDVVAFSTAQDEPVITILYVENQTDRQGLSDAIDSIRVQVPSLVVEDVSVPDIGQSIRHLSEARPAKTPDVGDFYHRYGPVSSPEHEGMAEWVQNTQLLERRVAWLNENFRLPYDVRIEAIDCDDDAYYDTLDRSIAICYGFVGSLRDLWMDNNRHAVHDADRMDVFVHDILSETLFHEAGHAAVHAYNLPYTGREENVADQFAALMLSHIEGGQGVMRHAADSYLYYAQSYGEDSSQDWGYHPRDMQRYYNYLCYAYGSDPDYNRDLADGSKLPSDRLEFCHEEFQQIAFAFGHLLKDHTNGLFD